MSRNKNWDRWIFASCAKYFDDFRGPYSLLVEGDIRTTQKLKQWAEFRLDGPYVKELARNCWRLDVEINIICLYVPDHTQSYGVHKIVGHFASLFDCIPVYRYGVASDDAENDGSFLGQLQLSTDRRESVRTTHFGSVSLEGVRLLQSNVEGHYRMHLDT